MAQAITLDTFSGPKRQFGKILNKVPQIKLHSNQNMFAIPIRNALNLAKSLKQGSQTQIGLRANEDSWSNPQAALGLLEGLIVTLTQQWMYLNPTRNSLITSSFMRKVSLNYREIISTLLFVRFKRTCSLAG